MNKLFQKMRAARSPEKTPTSSEEVDTLYALLYQLTHDPHSALDLTAVQTRDAFSKQWRDLKQGQYLLSDPWFREHVDRILCEEEIQIRREWFRGKDVLDAGCGNGRWSYGLAKLGANVTAVDVNEIAIEETREALADFDVRKEFFVTPLEKASSVLGDREFDLVFSWGVLHHCGSFVGSLEQIMAHVKDQGLLYLYLYGRESMSYAADLALFKQRLRYNTLPTEEQKLAFLLDKAGGDENKLHNVHDLYAPLVNRRLEFDTVREMIEARGFEDVTRTIDHTELFVRAVRGSAEPYKTEWFLPKTNAPYWFQHHA